MKDENDIIYNSYGLDTNIFKLLYEQIAGSSLNTSATGAWYDGLLALALQIWTIYSVIAFALSALFIFGIIYAYIRIAEYDEIEAEDLHDKEHRWHELHHGHHGANNRWQSVQNHLASENPNDWKLAIIEADVLLEKMLENAGFVGATVGEKLKSAATRSFETLQDAWQAHRVRNQIAHGGADFVLTHKLAKETLIQYERVFTEFGVLGEEEEGGHGGHH
jgi:hypothetical protein